MNMKVHINVNLKVIDGFITRLPKPNEILKIDEQPLFYMGDGDDVELCYLRGADELHISVENPSRKRHLEKRMGIFKKSLEDKIKMYSISPHTRFLFDASKRVIIYIYGTSHTVGFFDKPMHKTGSKNGIIVIAGQSVYKYTKISPIVSMQFIKWKSKKLTNVELPTTRGRLLTSAIFSEFYDIPEMYGMYADEAIMPKMDIIDHGYELSYLDSFSTRFFNSTYEGKDTRIHDDKTTVTVSLTAFLENPLQFKDIENGWIDIDVPDLIKMVEYGKIVDGNPHFFTDNVKTFDFNLFNNLTGIDSYGLTKAT